MAIQICNSLEESLWPSIASLLTGKINCFKTGPNNVLNKTFTLVLTGLPAPFKAPLKNA